MLNLSVVNGKIVGFKDGIYIGRGGKGKKQSPLANPYKIGVEGDRDFVLKLYRKWLWDELNRPNPEVIKELVRILILSKEKPVKLVCFCSPLKCHGDVIVSCLNWLEKNIEEYYGDYLKS
jgi:hypothetical protein